MVLKPAHVKALQWLVHSSALAGLLWLGYAIPAGGLGGDPVPELIHYLGKGALNLVLLTLLISPVVKYWRWGMLFRLRRPLGIWACVWALLHFAAWLALDLQFDWVLITGELVKRSYIIVGMLALFLLVVLTITSLPALQRKMGTAWKKLHNWIYAIALLAPIHYWWSLKSGWVEPLIYVLITLVLLGLRKDKLLRPWRARKV